VDQEGSPAVSAVQFRVQTKRAIERRDITEEVKKAAGSLGAVSGALLISTPHTTAAIVVGENWDPDVTSDMERALQAWVPPVRFEHGEGNSAAHFLSEAIGNARLVPLEDSHPVCGQWQGIFLVELDGPRERTVEVRVLKG
jgi:secondary thiamine-phosphate synthase enzyme